MVDKIKIDPNYWRNSYKNFIVNQAKYLELERPDIDWVSEITEETAQKDLERLEKLEVLIQNSFPLD